MKATIYHLAQDLPGDTFHRPTGVKHLVIHNIERIVEDDSHIHLHGGITGKISVPKEKSLMLFTEISQ